jgi:hypothetical protein
MPTHAHIHTRANPFYFSQVVGRNLSFPSDTPMNFVPQDDATRLKCMGVQAAVFGEHFAAGPDIVPLTVRTNCDSRAQTRFIYARMHTHAHAQMNFS